MKRSFSDLGDHFTKVIRGAGKKQAECNYCQEVFSYGDDFDISRLKEHQEEACPDYYDPQIGLSAGSFTEFEFNQLKSRKRLAFACIKHKYPLNIGEDDRLRGFFHSLNPEFKVPNQNTVEADVIAIYEQRRIRVHKLLDGIKCKLSLSTDIWTSDHSRVSYYRLTSHFIDDNWKLREKIVAFRRIPNLDDGESLFSCMKDMILEWNVGKKLCSIAVDNATVNDVMVEKLKDWLVHDSFVPLGRDLLHVRCCAHIIKLIVQDGLNQIRGLIEKIRAAVRYLNTSSCARQQFDQAKRQCGLEGRKALTVDAPNQWNSTFDLLEATLPLRKAFSLLQSMDENYHFNPSDSEWEVAEVVLECLQLFSEATHHFSGGKYPTSNDFFFKICLIHLKLIECRDSGNDFIREMSGPMKEKFDKYWDECNLLLAVAVVFDPRYKMALVLFLYRKIYGSAADSYVQRVRDCLNDLFISYESSVLSSVNEGALTSGSSDEDNDPIREFERQSREARALSMKLKSELDTYLDEPRLRRIETFNVLDWWKIKATFGSSHST